MAVKFSRTPTVKSAMKWAFVGPSDSGKTYTMLKMAKLIGGQWAMIDSDNMRSQDYAEEFETKKWLDRAFLSHPDKNDPEKYMQALDAVEEHEPSYRGVIIDTMTPFWLGILDIHEARTEELAKNKNREPEAYSIQAWAGRKGGNRPFYQLMTRIGEFPIMVFVSFRSKLEFSSEGGFLKPTGNLIPHFRRGDHMYEFSLVSWMERAKSGKVRNMMFEKTATCHKLEGETFPNPGKEVLDIVRKWREI